MKALLSSIFVLGLTSQTFAAEEAKVVLVKKLGGLAHSGVVNTCEIYSSHPKLIDRMDEIRSLIVKAEKDSLKTIALFGSAEIPSQETYAYLDVIKIGRVRRVKVPLFEVYASKKARDSTEAQELIKIANEICGD